jgi:hypothetical protein
VYGKLRNVVGEHLTGTKVDPDMRKSLIPPLRDDPSDRETLVRTEVLSSSTALAYMY